MEYVDFDGLRLPFTGKQGEDQLVWSGYAGEWTYEYREHEAGGGISASVWDVDGMCHARVPVEGTAAAGRVFARFRDTLDCGGFTLSFYSFVDDGSEAWGMEEDGWTFQYRSGTPSGNRAVVFDRHGDLQSNDAVSGPDEAGRVFASFLG